MKEKFITAKGCIQGGKQKQKHIVKRGNNHVFDGIKVTVNSDEEDLDYKDNVVDPEETGSLYNDAGEEVSSEKGEQTLVDDSVNNGLDLGASSASMNEDMIMNNPHLKRLLNKMLDERIKDAQERGESSGSRLLTDLTPKNS